MTGPPFSQHGENSARAPGDGRGTAPQPCPGAVRIQRETAAPPLGILSPDCRVTAVEPGSARRDEKGVGCVSTAPQPCPGTVRIQRETAASSLGIRLSSDCRVTAVQPGLAGSRAGLLVGMRVAEVNGRRVGSPGEMKAAAGGSLAFDMLVAMSSAGRQTGVVSAWRAESRIGFISPDVPLFNGEAVSTADVFLFPSGVWKGRSVAVGEKVAFTLSAHGVRFKATHVTSTDGGPPTPFSDGQRKNDGIRLLRAGADISSIVENYAAKSKTPLPEKRICMRHCAGLCVPGDRCAMGLHLNRDGGVSPSVDGSDGSPAMGKKCPPAVRFTNAKNHYQSNDLVFTADRASRSMSYTINGGNRREFRRMVWDGEVVDMPAIGQHVRVTDDNRKEVLTGLQRLADHARVAHNIFADDVLNAVSETKMQLLQQFVDDSCGGKSSVRVAKAWQLNNEELEWKFRCTEYNFTQRDGRVPDVIDGFHGTPEDNVLSIAMNGFDPVRRCGQSYGAGEYFAQDPLVSATYSRGVYMFICKLILGSDGTDHQWVPSTKFYIMKQRDGNVQALPMYLITFHEDGVASPLGRKLARYKAAEEHADDFYNKMGQRQRGGVVPEKGRRDGGMSASETRHLWVGWVDRELARVGEQALKDDMSEFLAPHTVLRVKADRNGARIGVFVELREPVSRFEFAELNTRLYRGKHRISVDDQQPGNPRTAAKKCPKLAGPERFCRGWNLRGHRDWTETCSFSHDVRDFATYGAGIAYEAVGEAKLEEIRRLFGGVGKNVVRVARIVNGAQEAAYASRRSFLSEKGGTVVEKDLWHGTNAVALETVLQRGVQCPSDTKPHADCPVSGKKNLCTTLCGNTCEHCVEPHDWNSCHMFGLGVYFADDARKSDRYVVPDANGLRAMVRCRVNLGNPYRIEANLLKQDAMHDLVRCSDPAALVDDVRDKWDTKLTHDSYYIKGLGARAKARHGCASSEYVVFHPAQVLPLYVVYYKA
ncbi:hypothetical protein DIPPA_01778 [Diplonema papillatum]|nr:hypothetical protein DIPPA_01778 [Diplonema papillatum]|eukprot:gene851-1308_t